MISDETAFDIMGFGVFRKRLCHCADHQQKSFFSVAAASMEIFRSNRVKSRQSSLINLEIVIVQHL